MLVNSSPRLVWLLSQPLHRNCSLQLPICCYIQRTLPTPPLTQHLAVAAANPTPFLESSGSAPLQKRALRTGTSVQTVAGRPRGLSTETKTQVNFYGNSAEELLPVESSNKKKKKWGLYFEGANIC